MAGTSGAMTSTGGRKGFLDRFLDHVERVGNKVPHPAVIFLILIAIVILLSHLLHFLGVSVTYPVVDVLTDEVVERTTAVQSLLTADGLRFMLTSPVANFMSFGPVAVILVAMIVAFAQKYQPEPGVGTVVALMLPYTVVLFIIWTLMLVGWYLLGIPLGFG